MPDKANPLCREVTIVNKLGMHTRPAAKIAAIAQTAGHRVWLSAGKDEVDAKSTMDILMLYRPQGSRLMIRIENDTDRNILSDIARLIRNGFGEST